jgi:hypothetical protein
MEPISRLALELIKSQNPWLAAIVVLAVGLHYAAPELARLCPIKLNLRIGIIIGNVRHQAPSASPHDATAPNPAMTPSVHPSNPEIRL